eukprot:1185050-Pyramimonas_sp.AAC.1
MLSCPPARLPASECEQALSADATDGGMTATETCASMYSDTTSVVTRLLAKMDTIQPIGDCVGAPTIEDLEEASAELQVFQKRLWR